MTKSRRPVSTAPVPSAGTTRTTTATLPVSKPRNRVAIDPLLRKSGAHESDDGKGGKKQARVAEQSLREEMATLRSRRRGLSAVADEDQ